MKNFVRGLSAVTFVNALNGVLGVVIVPIAVKRLGIEGYGLYSIFSVLSGYLVLVELGMGKNLVRLLGTAPSEREARDLLRLALGLYVTIAVALVALSPLIVPAVEAAMFRVPAPYVTTVYWIAVIAILDYLLGIPVAIRLNYALSRENISSYARFMLVSNASRYSLMLAGVLLTRRVEFALAFVLGRRLVDLTAAPHILPHLPEGSWRPRISTHEALALVGQSSQLALTQLLQLSTVAAGSVLVNGFFGLTALGVYRSAFDVVSKVWFFSNTAGTVLYPRFIQLLRREASRERLARVLPAMQNASWMACCLAAVAAILAAPFVLTLMRLSATPPLLFALLIIGVLWNAHATLSIELLQAGARFRTVGEAAAISFAVMTAVFLALAGQYPRYAIGWAWVVSQLMYSAFIDARAIHRLRDRVSLPRLGMARVPAAVLACSALAAISNGWTPALIVTGVVALGAMGTEVPAMWLDLSRMGRTVEVPVSPEALHASMATHVSLVE